MRRHALWLAECGAAAGALVLLMWANSGTLCGYAATLDAPVEDRYCGYLFNLDHAHFMGMFWFLEGMPREMWAFSCYFRRLLYHVLAFPFVEAFGYVRGGFLCNVALSVLGMTVFATWMRFHWGGTAGRAALWLLATFPGFAYWGGLPYNQASICTVTLLGIVLLDTCFRVRGSGGRVAAVLGMGVLCLAYDFLVIFAATIFVMALWRRRWVQAFLLPAVLAIPMALMLAWQAFHLDLPPTNDNTSVYPVILSSYLPGYDWAGWGKLLAMAPLYFGNAFLYSTFLGLPVAFLIGLALLRKQPAFLKCFSPAESCLGFVLLGLWLFCNLAPPYEGWQMRGYQVVRIYLPAFVFYVAFLSRATAHHRRVRIAVAIGIALNVLIGFGGLVKSPLTGWVYHRFNKHASRPMYVENLEKYGVRPIGFCREIENLERPFP